MHLTSIILSAVALTSRLVSATFGMCKNAPCTSCPVQVANEGHGYPHCVIYNTQNVFGNQGFPTNPSGGYEAWVHIPSHPGCGTIIKSPAGTSRQGCGVPIGIFNHPTCAKLTFDTTFMVQFCCGTGDCTAAGDPGLKRSVKFARSLNELEAMSTTNSFAMYLQHANGTKVLPHEIGPAPESRTSGPIDVEILRRDYIEDVKPAVQHLERRGNCNGHWKPDSASDADFTIPSVHTEIVSTSVQGPAEITITKERSQSFTTSMDLGFADIISLGISFSVTQETSDSKAYQFHVPAGQTGNVGFTPFLRCTIGTGTCGGKKVHGKVCTGYMLGGSIAGKYAVIESS